LLPLALAAALAAAAPPAQKQTAAAHARAGAPAPRRSDAEIEKDIRARFARSKIAVNNFQVRVQGGTATIEGRTDVLQHKATATRLARSAGAINVVNKVQVSEAARQKAAGTLTTGRRRAQVKRSEVERR
jgi:osmotically-inducible protein OsmY